MNKQATADNAYIHFYHKIHPEIPIENITVPAKHDFSFMASSMHTVALMWFGESLFAVCCLFIIIFQHFKEKGRK
jgi:hypothetical protein